MKFWETDDFKALQKAWYERLEVEGFQDSEALIGDDMLLRDYETHPPPNEADTNRVDYFTAVREMIERTTFDREADRIILTMHAEGATARAIIEKLRLMPPRSPPRFRSPYSHCRHCRNTIRSTIRRYEMRWGLRTYTAKELGDYRKGA
jgi:hypothetical protein